MAKINIKIFFIKISIVFSILLYSSQVYASTIKKVAITQIVSHPSLDKVKQGIIDVISKDNSITILFENAQGNITLTHQIAKKFIAKNVDVIVAIATPSAIAAKNAAKDTKIPVVFATVTDPIAAKLVSNLEKPEGNVTGVMNNSPIEKAIEALLEVKPNCQNIGIMYNPSEANSIRTIKIVQSILKKKEIGLVTRSIVSSNDISIMTSSLIGKVDAILLLQDNMIASSLSSIVKIANENKLLTVASFTDVVDKGVAIEVGIDEYEIGKSAGEMVIKILAGEHPNNISISQPNMVVKKINKLVLDKVL